MKNIKAILVVCMVLITAFSAFKYISSLKETYDLKTALYKMENELTTLKEEKQNILADFEKEKEKSSQLGDSLKTAQDALTKLNNEFINAQKMIEDLNSEVTSTREENTALHEEKDKIAEQLTQAAVERDQLQARMNSITELKKAIKELKIKMKEARRASRRQAAPRHQKVKQPAPSPDDGISGNGGYLLKNGISTYHPKIRIEVEPALK